MTSAEEVKNIIAVADDQANQMHEAGALGWYDTLISAATLLRTLLRERDEARRAWEATALFVEDAVKESAKEARSKALDEAAAVCEGVPLPGGGPYRHNPGWEGDWSTDGDTARTRNRCAMIILSLKDTQT